MRNSLKTRIGMVSESDNGLKPGLCLLPGLSLPSRYLQLIHVKDDGCWQWLGCTRSKKYKNRRYRYGTYCGKLAHRLMFQAVRGDIPADRDVDHICHNKLCVNPEHLQLLSHQKNCARRQKSGPSPDPNSQRSRNGFYARRALGTLALSALSIVLIPAARTSPEQALPSQMYKPWSANVHRKPAKPVRGINSPVKNPDSVNSNSLQLVKPTVNRGSENVGNVQSSASVNLVQDFKIDAPQAKQKLPNDSFHDADSDLSDGYARESEHISEISESGIARQCSGAWPDSAIKSQFSAELDWLLNPDKRAVDRTIELQADSPERAYERILSRIVQIEAHESNPHYRDDYRIAWHIVHICQSGEAVECTPAELAWYRVLGMHPAKVWPRMLANRQALLGRDGVVPFPKKPSPKIFTVPEKRSA